MKSSDERVKVREVKMTEDGCVVAVVGGLLAHEAFKLRAVIENRVRRFAATVNGKSISSK